MTRSSSRMIGISLAAAIMATGAVAMAQTSGSGSSTAPGSRTDMNNQGAPVMAPPANSSSSGSSGMTSGSSSGTMGGKSGTVETGNKAQGGSGTGTGQTPLPGDKTTRPMSGAGGK